MNLLPMAIFFCLLIYIDITLDYQVSKYSVMALRNSQNPLKVKTIFIIILRQYLLFCADIYINGAKALIGNIVDSLVQTKALASNCPLHFHCHELTIEKNKE